eukprot:TRINITY_DN25670_c0_g1_i1.p1 TRINITY_DN25670_c0_g1~~TRINITY_DN25670_c0_g1_i1.p1  ORF type:complete len:295 (-),score=71.44 TRINITY_DN25670_c0_g1_i1:94-978(-)
MASTGNIGMMEGAYFVGRMELLRWINTFLELKYAKIEQVCSGAACAQIVDALYPKSVPLYRIKFDAKHEYEYIQNWKVVQSAFDKLGIDKHINIQLMVKGKMQDNLEFAQWMKKFFDMHWNANDTYPAGERRRLAMAQAAKKKSAKGGPRPSLAPRTTATQRLREANAAAKKSSASPKPDADASTEARQPQPTPARPVTRTATAADRRRAKAAAGPKKDELVAEVARLRIQVEGLEKERDFYFNRLQEVEMLCQNCENDTGGDFIRKVKSILYVNDCDSDSTTSAASPDSSRGL